MNDGKHPDSEVVEVVAEPLAPGQRWQPAVGAEALDLLAALTHDPDEMNTVRAEALSILSRCVPPATLSESETGLVIGYVQSGKTLSFTLLSALARDNGFQVIIVVTGTSKLLFKQSTDRLTEDLRLDDRRDRKWMLLTNPVPRTDRRHAEAALRGWSDPLVRAQDRQTTLLITVMKQHTHLNALVNLLSTLDLTGVPALIVDDEADQASLNTTVQKSRESATYRRLVRIRQLFPMHTYLQYTATPQAPLLINLIDALSPNFAELLTPGADYLGGRELFAQGGQLVRTIPVADLPGAGTQNAAGPPDSLLEAMRVFFLGVSAFAAGDSAGQRNRAMMVHPSRETAGHNDFRHWIEQTCERWIRTLTTEDDDRETLLDEFRAAHADLAATVPGLKPFDDLVRDLPNVIGETRVTEVNTRNGETPEVEWRHPFHILVGGQALDRGFTVKGLTVTYMPREVGVGNADTVQQRARFFGYKRSYGGYCRVYLEAGLRAALAAYVGHEEDVRRRLAEHRRQGRPLVAWKRAFFLDPSLRPTRDNVLGLAYLHSNFSNEWFTPSAPHVPVDAIIDNRLVVREFISRLDFEDDDGDARRTAMQRHAVAGSPLRTVFEELLVRFRNGYVDDSQEFTGLLLQIEAHLETHPNAQATIFHIAHGAERLRSLGDGDEIGSSGAFFQGAYPTSTRDVYPGDSKVRSQDQLTVQIHTLRIDGQNGERIADNVPALAVWVPRSFERSWVAQAQGGT